MCIFVMISLIKTLVVVFNRVQFGDSSAAAHISLALTKACQIAYVDHSNYPTILKAANKLVDNMYVDDGSSGGSIQEIYSYISTKLQDGSYNSIFPKPLSKVSFKLKAIVKYGFTNWRLRKSLVLLDWGFIGMHQ